MIEYRLNLAGCDCAVAEWNPEGSTTVFALHGWLDNLASFEGLVKYMPDIRLIAVDFPGHGHSAHLSEGTCYHFIDGLYLIDDLVNHFDTPTLNLLGHSMGGAIATLYAASQANQLSKLVLIESLGPLTTQPESAAKLMQKAITQRNLLKGKSKPLYTSFEQALSVRAEVSQIEKMLIKPLVERALTHIEGGYTWRADSRLRVASATRLSEEQLKACLKQINVPVLLIEGDCGLLKNRESMQARKQDFSQLKTSTLPGGHHVHLEQPKDCGEQIQAFFKTFS